MNDHQTIIGRLAPSPTGAQHLGNARTYLIAWLMARSHQGTLYLRMEDIDSPRVKPWAAQQAMDDLKWLGLDWDGDVLVQTKRISLYQQALEKLQQRELVYPCTCTRSEVLQAASAPHEDGKEPVYPGTCSHRQVADAINLQGKPFCWRFRPSSLQPPTFIMFRWLWGKMADDLPNAMETRAFPPFGNKAFRQKKSSGFLLGRVVGLQPWNPLRPVNYCHSLI